MAEIFSEYGLPYRLGTRTKSAGRHVTTSLTSLAISRLQPW